MRPRTKLQLRVTALSATQPQLTDVQKQWAYKNCLAHLGYRTKTNTACMDCGNIWATKDSSLLIVMFCENVCVCPSCGTKLTIVDTRKKKEFQKSSFGLISTCEEFQLNRFFEVRSWHRSGKVVSHSITEVVQQWLCPGGKNEVIACNVNGYNGHFNGGLEIRDKNYLPNRFNVWPHRILPGAKYLSVYKRNGFKGIFHGIGPYDMFTSILIDTKAETLLKAGQFALLRAKLDNRNHDVHRYWDSIKICMRNRYVVKDAIAWLDYLHLLSYFKKDLYNLHYVCPKNLKKVHDILVAKKTDIDNRRRYIEYITRCDKTKDEISLKSLSTERLEAEYNGSVTIQREIARRDDLVYKLVRLGKIQNDLKPFTTDELETEYLAIIAERDAQERQAIEEKELRKVALEDAAYAASKAIFFGLIFSKNDITIKVLESVQEFRDEAKAHKHCVFSNGYYSKEDSLILSAKVAGKPVETIEISLSKMKVVQSRGLDNKASKYNQQIIELVNKNLPAIRRKYKQLKKVAA